MRIRMNRDRLFTPKEDRRLTYGFKGGQEYTVRRIWGARLVKAGDAVEVPAPPREPGSRGEVS